jgi:hypothetical protein
MKQQNRNARLQIYQLPGIEAGLAIFWDPDPGIKSAFVKWWNTVWVARLAATESRVVKDKVTAATGNLLNGRLSSVGSPTLQRAE